MVANNNNALYESLSKLVKEAFNIFHAHIANVNISSEYDIFLLSIKLMELDKSITEIDEFKKVDELMNEDKTISRHFGNLVGTSMGASTIESAKSCILLFLRKLFIKEKISKVKFDFLKEYKEFEDFFYLDYVKMHKKCILHNFECDLEKVEFDHGILIRKLTDGENIEYDLAFRKSGARNQFKRNRADDYNLSDFLIEVFFNVPKCISGKQMSEADGKNQNLDEIFDNIITSMRLLKESSSYCDNEIRTEVISYSPIVGTTINTTFYNNYTSGGVSKFSSLELDELRKIYMSLKDTNHLFKLAARRLKFGIERIRLEDKLIDFMIGLEAIYLPDSGDLKFKLSLRCALMLYVASFTEAMKAYKFLKDMYDLRSSIVHGNTTNREKLKQENLKILEEILRKTIYAGVKEPAKFNSENLEKLYFLGLNGIVSS